MLHACHLRGSWSLWDPYVMCLLIELVGIRCIHIGVVWGEVKLKYTRHGYNTWDRQKQDMSVATNYSPALPLEMIFPFHLDVWTLS